MITDEREKRTGVWIRVLFAVGPLLLYWLSIGPFFHWEQSARTQKQYHARKGLEHGVYAPVIWLEKSDPTRIVFKLDYLCIQPWVKVPFDISKLPAE